MSLSPDGGATDLDDSDSFHSFNQSESEFYSNKPGLSASWKSSLSSNGDSATGFESEHETSGTLENYSIEPLTLEPASPKQMERFKAPKKFAFSLLATEEPLPMCPWKVPKPPSKHMPSEERFNLDSPQLGLKEYLNSNPQMVAQQKLAFTEIWVDFQQKSSDSTRSPLRDFSVALDAYFNQDLTKVTLANKPVPEPTKTIVTPVKPAEPYVSPFQNMPVRPAPPKESSRLDGAKKPIIVPAGFDLTRLVEYKDPNHWARRRIVRTGDRIF